MKLFLLYIKYYKICPNWFRTCERRELTVTYDPLIVLASAIPSIGNKKMGIRAVAAIGMASVIHITAITMIPYRHRAG